MHLCCMEADLKNLNNTPKPEKKNRKKSSWKTVTHCLHCYFENTNDPIREIGFSQSC